MSKVANLKKKAADLEKKSPDKAISVYVELLAEMEKEPGELDVALFNRVGDLMVKSGNTADAVDYYEKAVDHYVDGGFFNNAIALCNKILRTSPGRATVYYKLGKISAHKGFKADAKQNFLEYADRMQKAGKVDEAFRALGEFADLCPDQTDIRLMLAEQLTKAGKKDQAIEQLQILHAQLDAEGATAEAQAAAERLHALDPDVEPRRAGDAPAAPSGGGSGDLIFLDLSDSPSAANQRRTIAGKRTTMTGMKAMDDRKPTPPVPAPVVPPPRAAAPPAPAAPPPPPPPPVAAAPEPEPEPEPIIEQPPSFTIETTSLSEPASIEDSGSLLGLESTSLTDSAPAFESGGLLDLDSTSLGGEASPAAEPPVEEASTAGSLDFIMPGEDEAKPVAAEAETPLLDDTLDLHVELPGAEAEKPADLAFVDTGMELDIPAAPVQRPSTMMAVKSVEMLQAVVDGDPDDWASHRELAEAMLEAGDRDGGVRELEIAMLGFERAGDLGTAMSVADEIVRVDPSSVKHHQKRVEYAYRSNDKPQLVEAYIALADALFRNGQVDKSRSIYQRVLELSPDDVRAQAAISTMPEAAPAPVPDRKTPANVPRQGAAAAPPAVGRPTPVADDAFVNLGDWLREDEGPKDTRMVVAEEEPTGNEEADFADMLKKFKQGVAENVEAEDYQSHYDLGVAFKEMGLVDEAIAEFQKALRGPENRTRTYEAIGNCFIEKGQHQMAATILARALGEKGLNDEQLIGVLYLLGRANEALGRTDQALEFYQRVFVVDITFHDVGDRLNALENAAR
ncbi:MAG TPA: tetratricopeptide repeat protein [Gemmatimonadaceae bacterium]|nr:tetratricopeptide repeat protein [Gemmatimonadaceae bacterium]